MHVVPEKKKHTDSMEGHQKLLGGGGLRTQILEAKFEDKLEFPWRKGEAKQKIFPGGSNLDIFWNCTIIVIPIMNVTVTYRMSNICNKHNNVGNF